MPSNDILGAFFNRALEEEIGIGVKVTMDHVQFRDALYVCRKAVGDKRWDEIMIFMPNDGRVWLVKKSTEMKE